MKQIKIEGSDYTSIDNCSFYQSHNDFIRANDSTYISIIDSTFANGNDDVLEVLRCSEITFSRIYTNNVTYVFYPSDTSDNITISDCTFNNSVGGGGVIILDNCDDVNITNINFTSSNTQTCFEIEDVSNIFINNITTQLCGEQFVWFYDGVFENILMENISIDNVVEECIYIDDYDSFSNTVFRNITINNASYGVYIDGSGAVCEMLFDNITVTNTTYHAIYITDSNHIYINNSTIRPNLDGNQAAGYDGIYIDGTGTDTHNITIHNCTISHFIDDGIYMQYVDSLILDNSTILDTGTGNDGIELKRCNYTYIYDNFFRNLSNSIYLYKTDYTYITNNYMNGSNQSATKAIGSATFTRNTTINNNTIWYMNSAAITLDTGYILSVTNNFVRQMENYMYSTAYHMEDFFDVLISNNTFYGSIACEITCDTINIYNYTIRENYFNVTRGYYPLAIYTSGTDLSDFSIINNILSDSDYKGELYLYYADNVIISRNTISHSTVDGFNIESVDVLIIDNNTISNVTLDGLSLDDTVSNATIRNNKITTCSGSAIYLADDCRENTVKSNYVNSSAIGITLTANSLNNLVYNNYFHNTDNVDDLGTNNRFNVTKTLGTNIIGGPYLMGNYWSDYTGTDADYDGIGDTPYET